VVGGKKLADLSKDERSELVKRLHGLQNELCYVCGDYVNLQVHPVDVDHIVARHRGGVDEESNWGLAHASCNRSKGSRDLQFQRFLHRLRTHVEKHSSPLPTGEMRSFTVKEALDELMPTRQDVGVLLKDGRARISYNLDDKPITEEFQLLEDKSSGVRSFVGMVPFSCLHHDPDINPRSIVDLEGLMEEFYNGNPQLQPSLATLTFSEPEGTGRILLFDGQHKAAAQLYIGNERLLVRVFVNPDRNRLKEVNFRAHTKLAQVHFPQLIHDRVGHDLFREEFDRFLLSADTSKHSEDRFFAIHVPPEQRPEFRAYFTNYLRYRCLTGEVDGRRNELLDFVETIEARSKRYPLSYDTVQSTFLGLFLGLKPANLPLVQSEPLRQLERENLVRLCNIFVEEVLAKGRYDPSKGIFRIEQRLRDDPNSIPDAHLAAYRICRRPAMVVWMKELRRAIGMLLGTRSKYQKGEWAEQAPLWAPIDDVEWERIRKMFRVVRQYKVWAEKVSSEVVNAASSSKQGDWQEILLEGRLPGREEALLPKLDFNYIFGQSQR
jgi:hypothetical protein